jgi:UDP:flavonoid glycosyltransferase YjiC (YdhE family)
MLVMPYAHDQPDNADRVRRLGVARVVARRLYTAGHAAAELRRLLGDPKYAARAAAVGERVRAEDGVTAACDAIEKQLRAGSREVTPPSCPTELGRRQLSR